MQNRLFWRSIVVFSTTLISTSCAQAIPPPEALLSVWQSALQMLGVASVFLVSAYFSARQFFSQWKKPILLLAIISIVSLLGLGFYHYGFNSTVEASQPDIASSPPEVINNASTMPADVPVVAPTIPAKIRLLEGEKISVEDTIKREKDDFVRNWKYKTLKEMKRDLARLRKQKNLPIPDYKIITSFTPRTLYLHRQKSPGKLYFLDVREAYERKKFHIPYQASVRYGDLANAILTPELSASLPKNKRIVVLCHSGLRGYLAASLLQQLGYNNVSFLQGGLANWHQQKLPVEGNPDFFDNISRYPLFSKKDVKQAKDVQKVQIDVDGNMIRDIPGLIQLPYENATTAEISKIVETAKTKPVLIVCQTYGGCFHSVNFSYVIEQAGGKVAGVYDKKGEFLIAPIIQ